MTPSAHSAHAEPGANRLGSGICLRHHLQSPILILVIVGGLLAVTSVFAKLSPALGWHPLALLQWSVGGGALLLFAGGRKLGHRTSEAPAGKTDLSGVAVFMMVSGLFFVVPNMIAAVSAPRVGAGFVSLTYAFPLVLTYALAVAIGLDRFHLLRAAGTLSGVFGAVLLASCGASIVEGASVWVAMPLAIPVLLAVGNIYRSLKWPAGMRPVDMAVGMLVVGFVALLVFNFAIGVPMLPQAWTSGSALLLAAQTAIYGVQFALYFRLQKEAGPVYLSQIGSVAAVIGLALGYLVFSEVPDLAKIGAALAVGLGIILVSAGQPGSSPRARLLRGRLSCHHGGLSSPASRRHRRE